MDRSGEGHAGGASPLQGAFLPGKRRGWASDLLTVAAVAVSALLIGGSVNVLRVDPLPWKYQSREQILGVTIAQLKGAPTPAATGSEPLEPTHEIRLEEFQSFVAEHKGPVLDARPSVFYHEAHIPGALSLPRETFTEDYSRLRGQLEADKDRRIAVYCSGADCPDSQLVAEALTKLGYRRLVIYTSGWEEWSSTGLPQEGAAATP